MENFIKLFATLTKLLPLIVDAVRAVEAAFPQAGAGALKTAMIKNMMQQSYATLASAEVSFDSMWPTLEGVIANAVKIEFPKSTSDQPTNQGA